VCTDKYSFSPVPNDCSKYLRCDCGVFVEYKCPAGTFFDYKTKVCNLRQHVQCYQSPLKPTVTPVTTTTQTGQLISFPECNESDGLLGYPGDCNLYKQCDNGKWIVNECLDDLHFDYIRKICTYPSIARCLPCSYITLPPKI